MHTDDMTRPREERRAGLFGTLQVPVQLWLALAFMALAFAGGFLVRGMVSATAEQVVGPAPAVQAPGEIVPAPPLSEEDIQGGLPPDHPPVEGQSPGAGSGEERTGDPAAGSTDETTTAPDGSAGSGDGTP